MESFAEKHGLLHDYQFGFRKGSSPACSLLTLTDSLYKQMDEGHYSAILSLDLSKAFDSIPHNLLLQKLEWYGFRGKISELLRNYLSNRQQFVSVGHANSEKLPISKGVPQGAILSPF